MRLGLGLSLGSTGGGGAAVFNPTTLSLTGWWRANYAASPWAGTASAGVSGSNSATEATNPPSAGAAVNGLTPASFDGVNDEISPAGTLDTYAAANAFSGWALVNITTISTNSATLVNNDCIIGTKTSTYFGIFLKDAAGTRTVHAYAFAGGDKSVSETIATGAWQLVQWKLDGTNMKLRVNSGTWQSVACGNIGSLAEGVRIGADRILFEFINGRVADVGLSDLVLSDGDFDNVKAYINDRYALSL